jgi:hypothetical protein
MQKAHWCLSRSAENFIFAKYEHKTFFSKHRYKKLTIFVELNISQKYFGPAYKVSEISVSGCRLHIEKNWPIVLFKKIYRTGNGVHFTNKIGAKNP